MKGARQGEPRAVAMTRRFEKPVLLASVLVIPTIIVETSAGSGDVRSAASLLNWLIWLVFVAEIGAVLAVTPDRWGWLRSHPLHAIIVVVTVPFLPASLQAARAFRLARLVRLVLVLQMARRFLSPEGLRFAAAIAGLGILGGAAAFQAAERATADPPTLWDSIWWAVTTVTTVGYGDFSPETALGRVVGIALMALGIGFVALLTGALAQRLLQLDTERIEEAETRVEAEEHAIAEELRAMARRLVELERQLSRTSG